MAFGWLKKGLRAYGRGMDAAFGRDEPTKKSIPGSAFGFVPNMSLVPPRRPGESDLGYKTTIDVALGRQAEAQARAKGFDTSGMHWANHKGRFEDSSPNTYIATMGKMLVGGLATAGVANALNGASTVSSLVGPATTPAQAGTTAAVQAGTQAGTGAFLGAAANTVPAWVNPAIQAAAAGTPAVANLFAAPQPVSGPIGTTTPQAGLTRPPTGVNLNATNGYRIPGVGTVTGRDILDYGVGITQWLMNRRQNNEISDAQLRAAQDALDWAKEQYKMESEREELRYRENRDLEQRRYDEYNARRGPYREASLASLAELRKLIGI